MSADPNQKSPRTFHCRDALWETFEQMGKDLDCSVDYLINESMKQYARSKNYGARVAPSVGPPGTHSQPLPSQGTANSSSAMTQGLKGPSRIPPPPARGASNLPPPPPRGSMPPPMPRQPASGNSGALGPTLKSAAGGPPPRQPSSPRLQPEVPAKPATLSIVYKGEKFPVTKDRFILGRGRQTSDFTLKDPNVSRQHAMIELQNGTYFMVDMGSTNGVEFNGQRVARKPIAEGDVYTICDHELVCTYR